MYVRHDDPRAARTERRSPALIHAILRLWIALTVACGAGGGGEANQPSLDAGSLRPDAGGGDSALVRLEVTSDLQLPLGAMQQLAATGVYRDNTTREVTAQVSWASDHSDVLVVSASGRATAIAPGTATVTASLTGVTGTTTITATAATLLSIAVTPAAPRVPVGMTQRLVATGTYSDSTTHDLTDQATWASDATATADVSNVSGTRGTVTAQSAGTTRITATVAGVTGAVSFTAVAVSLVSIAVTAELSNLPAEISEPLTATGTFSDGTTQDLTTQVTWTSDASNIIGVSTQGLAFGLAAGTVHITAALSGLTGRITLTGTRDKVIAISISPNDADVVLGTTLQMKAVAALDNGTGLDVTDLVLWTSNVPALAVVSNGAGSHGLVTARALGALDISATIQRVTAQTPLTVLNGVLRSIAVTPADASMPIGRRDGYHATGQFDNGTTQDMTGLVTWAVHDPNIALISGEHGEIRALALGHTVIDARYRSFIASTGLTVTPVALDEFEIEPSFASLPAGFNFQFTAAKVFTDDSVQEVTDQVTWSSDDPAVATVSNADGSRGVVTTVAPGSTVIRGVLGDLSTQTPLSVNHAALTGIGIGTGPSFPSVPIGLTLPLTATGAFDDHTTFDVTDSVTWTSATPAVATVSNQHGSRGLVTGVAIGSTGVTASRGSVTGRINLSVTQAVPLSIAITPENPQVVAGRTLQLTAIGTMSDGSIGNVTEQCGWASGNTGIATVSTTSGSSGLVTGRTTSPTPVRITCTGGNAIGVTAVGTTNLTVLPAVVEKITVLFYSPFPAGKTARMLADTQYSDGTITQNAPLVWSSDNPAVASVTSNGQFKALSVGTALLTASLEGVSGSRAMQVIPAALVSLAITPDTPTLPAGRSVQLTLTGTYTDGTALDLTSQATWTSLNPDNATVTSTGLVHTLGGFGATIRASLAATGGQPAMSDDDLVRITGPVLDSIAVSPAQASLAVGQTLAFTARGTFSDLSTLDLTSQVAWASSATGVATISSSGTRGIATAVAPGTASITAALGTITSPAAALTVTASAVAPPPAR